MHGGFVWQLHQLSSQRIHDRSHRTAPQIGAPDASREQRISGKKLRSLKRHFVLRRDEHIRFNGQIQRNASRRMPRRVHHVCSHSAPSQHVAFFQQLIDLPGLWPINSQKLRLLIHDLVKREIFVMHHHRSACRAAQLRQAADVIDVRMRADDRLRLQLVSRKEFENALGFIAWIDHQRFPALAVSQNRAVALKHTHWNCKFHEAVLRRIQSRGSFRIRHAAQYSIAISALC